MSSDFPLESLLALAEAEPPHLARQSILQVIMAIDYAGGIAERVCRLDERLAALRALEAEAHARVLASLQVGGEPPAVPPPAVGPAFTVLTAVQTAIEKLDAALVALRRKAGPGPNVPETRCPLPSSRHFSDCSTTTARSRSPHHPGHGDDGPAVRRRAGESSRQSLSYSR